ncbi:hypothetical protein J1N35_018575 [Gossypium stocksii]|uniref:Uncharacterized protein n=1 Tax=Gossypium stocksii TaxID=47602 RepID=A0A9D3VQY3_9ROSI|nr:hypothetical protein J1N35_018575 [Gossypium stocksii]
MDPNVKQNRSSGRDKGSGGRDIFNKAREKSGQSFNVGQGNKKGTIGPSGSKQVGRESIHLKGVVLDRALKDNGLLDQNKENPIHSDFDLFSFPSPTDSVSGNEGVARDRVLVVFKENSNPNLHVPNIDGSEALDNSGIVSSRRYGGDKIRDGRIGGSLIRQLVAGVFVSNCRKLSIQLIKWLNSSLLNLNMRLKMEV